MRPQTAQYILASSLKSFILLILFLLSSGCTDSIPTLSPLSPDAVVVAFGDSLTFGTGARAEQSFPANLAALSGYRIINAGVPGELSAQGLQRLPQVLDEHQPQLLILCHGGNDLLRKQSKSALADNLRQMIRLARQRGTAVILLGVPEPKLVFMQAAELYAELAREFELPIENEIVPQVEADNSLKSDPIHPNAQGYRRIAEAVYRLMQKSGTI